MASAVEEQKGKHTRKRTCREQFPVWMVAMFSVIFVYAIIIAAPHLPEQVRAFIIALTIGGLNAMTYAAATAKRVKG